MKTFIIVFLLLTISILVDARTTYQVPKDAVIKVFDANGKQIGEMSRSEYKVVRLRTNTQKKKTLDKPKTTPRPSSNEVILHIGKGPNGLDVDKNANTYSISKDEEVVFGATYCHTPEQEKYDLGICGTYISNDTFLGGFKFGF